MSRATPRMRDFAERLIACEANANPSLETRAAVAVAAGEKLRAHFATFVGRAGMQALHSRALVLAARDVPWLRAVRVETDGSFAGWDEAAAHAGPEKTLEGRTAMLVQLLGLLVTFIGENLTSRLTEEVWPELAADGRPFNEGEENEKTKGQA